MTATASSLERLRLSSLFGKGLDGSLRRRRAGRVLFLDIWRFNMGYRSYPVGPVLGGSRCFCCVSILTLTNKVITPLEEVDGFNTKPTNGPDSSAKAKHVPLIRHPTLLPLLNRLHPVIQPEQLLKIRADQVQRTLLTERLGRVCVYPRRVVTRVSSLPLFGDAQTDSDALRCEERREGVVG